MSGNKAKRLLKALSNESVKRLPYIILVLVILSLIQFIRISNQTAQSVKIATGNSLDNRVLLNKVAELAKDNKNLSLQNKALIKQNVRIAHENARHVDCIAGLFAKYTRDGQVIFIDDLTKCFITEDFSKTNATDAQNASLPSSLDLSAQSSCLECILSGAYSP